MLSRLGREVVHSGPQRFRPHCLKTGDQIDKLKRTIVGSCIEYSACWRFRSLARTKPIAASSSQDTGHTRRSVPVTIKILIRYCISDEHLHDMLTHRPIESHLELSTLGSLMAEPLQGKFALLNLNQVPPTHRVWLRASEIQSTQSQISSF